MLFLDIKGQGQMATIVIEQETNHLETLSICNFSDIQRNLKLHLDYIN